MRVKLFIHLSLLLDHCNDIQWNTEYEDPLCNFISFRSTWTPQRPVLRRVPPVVFPP
jgi:hypothetical protein